MHPAPTAQPATKDESLRLENIGVAFAASRDALEHAYRQGLSPDAKVRTSAPALIADPKLTVEPLEADLSAARVAAFSEATLPFCQALAAALAADPETQAFTQGLGQRAVQLSKMVYKCLTLSEDDYRDPRAIIQMDTGNPAMNGRVNVPWDVILAGNPNLSTCMVPKENLPSTDFTAHVNADFWTRLRFQSADAIKYRMWLAFWRRVPFTPPRGSYLILRDNDLLRETATNLARRGYALRQIGGKSQGSQALTGALADRLAQAVREPLRAYLDDWLTPSAANAVETFFVNHALEYGGLHLANQDMWRRTLDDNMRFRPQGVLTNTLKWPHSTAFYPACKERGIPVIAFQHAHSREITTTLRTISIAQEECASDLLITYNERAAQASEANPFAIAKSVPAGLPRGMIRTGTYRRRDTSRPPIFYVSTALQTGHLNLPATATWSDSAKAQHEADLIENVFAKLPHRVLYKPYPTQKYFDPPPSWQAAQREPNVEFYAAGADLRYMLPDSRVIVTSRATGTLGWCLAADRPLVYIDLPNHYPMQPELEAALAPSVFVFNGGAPDLWEQLRSFLSRPLDTVDFEWQQRAPQRARMFEEFFGNRALSAGRRAATQIVQFVRHR